VKLATSAVPIVFAVAVDPVGAGLVASLAMPGGNATGLSSQTGDLGGKRLELLREVVSGLRRLAILGNTSYRAVVQEMGEVAAAAKRAFGASKTRVNAFLTRRCRRLFAPQGREAGQVMTRLSCPRARPTWPFADMRRAPPTS
jgi:hypothetical protein